MINTKGEWIYTSAEIAYELGLSPATINAVGRRLYGSRIAHWTIGDAQKIVEYIKSLSVEEDMKRLALLHDTIAKCGYEKQDDNTVKARFQKDRHRVP